MSATSEFAGPWAVSLPRALPATSNLKHKGKKLVTPGVEPDVSWQYVLTVRLDITSWTNVLNEQRLDITSCWHNVLTWCWSLNLINQYCSWCGLETGLGSFCKALVRSNDVKESWGGFLIPLSPVGQWLVSAILNVTVFDFGEKSQIWHQRDSNPSPVTTIITRNPLDSSSEFERRHVTFNTHWRLEMTSWNGVLK